jgi:hypothetical protein
MDAFDSLAGVAFLAFDLSLSPPLGCQMGLLYGDYLFGYQRHPNHSIQSSDVQMRTYFKLVASLRDAHQGYLNIHEDSRVTEALEDEDIPF